MWRRVWSSLCGTETKKKPRMGKRFRAEGLRRRSLTLRVCAYMWAQAEFRFSKTGTSCKSSDASPASSVCLGPKPAALPPLLPGMDFLCLNVSLLRVGSFQTKRAPKQAVGASLSRTMVTSSTSHTATTPTIIGTTTTIYNSCRASLLLVLLLLRAGRQL